MLAYRDNLKDESYFVDPILGQIANSQIRHILTQWADFQPYWVRIIYMGPPGFTLGTDFLCCHPTLGKRGSVRAAVAVTADNPC